MNTEYEVKFYPVDKDLFIPTLVRAGAQLIQPETTMVVLAYNQTLNPQINGDYVRIRNEGDKVRLSVKIHAQAGGEVSDQKELEVLVSDFNAMTDILQRVGLHRTGFQEKKRETWDVDGAEVVIDTWPGLKTYIEIEAKSEQHVKDTAIKLGFDWHDRIVTSVVEIYMRVYGLTADEALQYLQHATFEHNPFASLQIFDEKSKLA